MNDIHEAKIAPGVGQRWTKGALAALHVGAESVLTHRLDAAYILFPLLANLSVQITKGGERKTLTRRDLAVLAQAMDALGLKKDPVCKYYKAKLALKKSPFRSRITPQADERQLSVLTPIIRKRGGSISGLSRQILMKMENRLRRPLWHKPHFRRLWRRET